MITPRMILRAKNYVTRNRLRSVIHDELGKKGILNASTGKPFSKVYIDYVLRGERQNYEIEKAFMEMILEMKRMREALEEEFEEAFAEEIKEQKRETLSH